MCKYIIFFFFTLFTLFAQKGKQPQHFKSEAITVGDKFFNNGDYYLAIQNYKLSEASFANDPYLAHQLAESQRLTYDFLSAENNYKIVVDYIDKTYPNEHHSDDYPIDRFRYASVLKSNNKCDLAKEQFEQFIHYFKKGSLPDDQQYYDRALLEYNGCTYLQNQKNMVERDFKFEILPSPVNTQSSEYAPAIFDTDTAIAITASRISATKGKVYNKTGESFSDIFMMQKQGESWADVSTNKNFNHINEILNEGAGCFNIKKDKFYFTKCNVSYSESNGECHIYVSKLENDKWTTPKILNDNVNTKGYWSAQPALSANGDTLFFVSKRPKGKGNHDIWYCTKSGDNENWSPAINMDKINTPFSEVSPFFHPKTKTLFFSSNGYESLGELDVYRTLDSSWTQVQNLGVPFNSSRDDFYFILGDKYGYLTSNRANGKGSDDIYKFNVTSFDDIIAIIPKDSIESSNSIAVNGHLMLADKTTPASNIAVLIIDSAGNVIRKSTTDDSGKFRFESLEGKKSYKVILQKKRTDVLASVEYSIKDYKLRKSDTNAIKGSYEHVFFDFDDYKLRPEGKIVLDELFEIIKTHPELQIELTSYTDNFGPVDYNKKLSELRSKEAFDYLRSKGIDKTALVEGFGEDNPLASNLNPIGRQLNRRLDFGLIGVDHIKSDAQAYISTIHQTVNDVSRIFNIPKEKIMAMNGLLEEDLNPFRPVRVPTSGTGAITKVTLNMANGNEYNKFNKQYDHLSAHILENKGIITVEVGQTYYTVVKGNTVFSIAKFFRTTPEQIVQLNNLEGFALKLGQKLKVIDNREKED